MKIIMISKKKKKFAPIQFDLDGIREVKKINRMRNGLFPIHPNVEKLTYFLNIYNGINY